LAGLTDSNSEPTSLVTIQLLSHDLAPFRIELRIEDLNDCQLFAAQIARHVKVPLCIALSGTLGAGKTQWTRFFASALGALPETVSSPTFMLVHEYDSKPPIYHLDAYRVGDEEEMLELGIEEMLDAEAVTIVEWADRFPRLLPAQTLRVDFELGASPECRHVHISANGENAKTILHNLVNQWGEA
jgi:tRNA threonylcarbamoyladenosine biosynthesis protein TsaE